MDYHGLSDSSVHGIFQARVLVWVAITVGVCKYLNPTARFKKKKKKGMSLFFMAPEDKLGKQDVIPHNTILRRPENCKSMCSVAI